MDRFSSATRLCALVASLLLAGCLADSKGEESPASDTADWEKPSSSSNPVQDGTPSAAGPGQETFWVNGSFGAMILHTAGTVNDRGTFFQYRAYETLTATLTWTSPAGLQDLDVALVTPGEEGSWFQAQAVDMPGWHVNRAGLHGMPDAPSTVRLDRSILEKFDVCSPCEWSAWALAKGGAAQVSYSIRIDVTLADEKESV